MTDDPVTVLLAALSPDVRELTVAARGFLADLVPDWIEEPDPVDRLLVYTYRPGTNRGAVVAVQPQRNYVNLVFSRGAELAGLDAGALLEGTGKVARHMKLRAPVQLQDPRLRELVEVAAARTREDLGHTPR
ncbi:MAG: hypothetical protein JWN54_2535 [Mycobacterium sp.]|jgi:hypothetical protein|nr:hypothetical protein [Mycobacterium sp.]